MFTQPPGFGGLAGPAAIVHNHHRATCLGHKFGHGGVHAQAPNVVDPRGPGRQGRLGHPGPVGINREGQGYRLSDRFDYRQNPIQFRLGPDRPAARPGAFAADVQDICPGFGEIPRLGHGCFDHPGLI